MRHFIGFIILVFAGLSAFYVYHGDSSKNIEDKKIYVYASSSFIAKWGPGPALKELFEKQSLFKVELVESADVNMTLQKISYEGDASQVDVVIGLDQFDVARFAGKIKWREIERSGNLNFVSDVRAVSNEKSFIPYDWAPLSFVMRKSKFFNISKMDDLLQEPLRGKIALEDPRTSSPGLQFLVWVFENKSPEEGVAFLKSLQKQVQSYSPSWSSAYGLFKNEQADMVFSYVTSPVYHLVEEKDDGFTSVETVEPLPSQVEFVGMPATCKNCEAAELFVNFLLSPEAQKIIMNHNYMFPVIEKVKEATPFDALKIYRTLPVKFYEQNKIEKWLNTWSEIRKNETH